MKDSNFSGSLCGLSAFAPSAFKFLTSTQPQATSASSTTNNSLYKHKLYHLPFYQHAVSAGFPSPAEDEMEILDLNELLIRHPSATFFLRVSGSSMIKAGIHDRDILVVDRSLEPAHGKIVIAVVNGELTVKRLHKEGRRLQLIAENDAYAPIDITEEIDLRIWGVVTSVIHPL